MSEYLYIPNFKHKNTVYLKLNTPVYCIPKNPGRPWQTHWSIHLIDRSTVLMSYRRSTHLAIPRFLDLLIHWSTDPPIYSSSDPLIYRSTTDLLIYSSTDPLIYRSTVLAIYHRSTDLFSDLVMYWWSTDIYRSTDLAIHRSTDQMI